VFRIWWPSVATCPCLWRRSPPTDTAHTSQPGQCNGKEGQPGQQGKAGAHDSPCSLCPALVASPCWLCRLSLLLRHHTGTTSVTPSLYKPWMPNWSCPWLTTPSIVPAVTWMPKTQYNKPLRCNAHIECNSHVLGSTFLDTTLQESNSTAKLDKSAMPAQTQMRTCTACCEATHCCSDSIRGWWPLERQVACPEWLHLSRITHRQHGFTHVVQHVAVDLRFKTALIGTYRPLRRAATKPGTGLFLDFKLQMTEAQSELAKYSACTCTLAG